MIIEMKVSLHQTGNRTLMQRNEGEGWSDVKTPKGVWANKDTAEFYRVVANYIAELSQTGHTIHFQDTQLG